MSARVTVDRADLELVLTDEHGGDDWYRAADRLRAALAPEPETTREPEGVWLTAEQAAYARTIARNTSAWWDEPRLHDLLDALGADR